jgi:ABC-type sugar transport system substrate-binding protein
MRRSLRWKQAAAFFLAAALSVMVCACGDSKGEKTGGIVSVPDSDSEQNITIGFSQLGAESSWRVANTQSIEDAFSDSNRYNLIFNNGRQIQDNQIKAIRNFIQQQVDYIIFSPLSEDGWDTVLEETKEAGIPVIIVDRMVKVSDDSLYTAWIGSDMQLEGEKAAEWMHAYFKTNGIDESTVNVVDIQGTMGSSPQIGRSSGLENGCAAYGWHLLAQETGEFVKAKAYEVMESMLKAYPELNVVYCENDGEAAGVLQALEENGITPGTDIEHGQVMVISFDATREGLQAVETGQIALDVECNPLQGPEIRGMIEKMEKGVSVPKLNYVDEEMFSHDQSVQSITADGRSFPVKYVTDDLIEKRKY